MATLLSVKINSKIYYLSILKSEIKNKENFKEIIEHTQLNQVLPFDFDCEFIKNHFGKDRQRQVRYLEFSQILHDFHEEHAIQAFRKFDTNNNGHILASNFKTILLQLKSHLLSPYMKENIETVIIFFTQYKY
jgi:solute carrier family 25 aspartate/glutamate transporter 12/13